MRKSESRKPSSEKLTLEFFASTSIPQKEAKVVVRAAAIQLLLGSQICDFEKMHPAIQLAATILIEGGLTFVSKSQAETAVRTYFGLHGQLPQEEVGEDDEFVEDYESTSVGETIHPELITAV